ncbi:MAG TPA: right-handed parallel beta-helix repeat-containing protein [Armatimonadota bacterium]|nr:right-handed parallel beta-helix repeat-containing protein [Armatimonadota bacterium]
MRALGLLTLCILLASCSFAQVNQAMIDAVKAGDVTEAKASWWGFDADDSTAALQAAIDSGAEKLIVEDMGSPWVVEKIELASNQEIVFEDGVEVRAKRGSYKGKNDCLFTARLKENITLFGSGATLRMWRDDYAGPDYDKAEWRHVLSILSSTNIKVHGLTLAESGGDGIYLGVGQAGVTNKGIEIKDVICDKNYRQGISVISAEDLLIENTIMRDTGGTAPQAGIDFEPNKPGERIVNCVMRDCLVENNNGPGYVLYVVPLNGSSADCTVLIENCTSIGNSVSAGVATSSGHEDGELQGLIEFVDCTFADSRNSAITIRKPADACRVVFRDCDLIRPAADAPQAAPIAFGTRPGDTKPVGGARFENCTIEDAVERAPISLNDWSGAVSVADVTGNITLVRGDERVERELTPEVLAEWMPTLSLREFDAFDLTDIAYAPHVAEPDADALARPTFRFRGAPKLLTHANEGDEVGFTVRYQQLAKYSGAPRPIRIVGPTGEEVAAPTVEFQADTPVMFTAPVTGTYEIHIDVGGNWGQVLDATHPVCFDPGEGAQGFLSTVGDLYFLVPDYVPQFSVKLYGDNPGEGLKAALYDANGELVEEQDNITRPVQFIATPGMKKAIGPGAVWRLHVSKPTDMAMEDFSVKLEGLPPLLAASPDALLAPTE